LPTHGEAFIEQRQFANALKEYDIALQTHAQLTNEFPDDRDRQRDLAVAYERKGDALEERNAHDDLRDAADTYKQGMAIIDEFMLKDRAGGKILEQIRKDLQEKIRSLPPNLQ
jgi:hypothetical protein